MLAYVFWHRPRDEVDRDRYEEALRRFHGSLDNPSQAFRLDRLPFAEAGGYEDWYLVENWSALGVLNESAVDAAHGGYHDAAAELVAEGWGGVYALKRGDAEPPAAVDWRRRPPEEPGTPFWQRQMVLGPAPEYCVVETGGQATCLTGRVPICDLRSS